VQEDFSSGKRPVLVATNAFGMGIDKANVRAVIHYDIPGSVEAYYQEAGRAGRDSQPSRAVLLFNHADVATQEYFISELGAESAEVGRLLLKQLVRYVYSSDCRQRLILEYFGDAESKALRGCGICDRCRPIEAPVNQVNEATTLAARQSLAAVARVNGRFGKTRVCEILTGSRAAPVLALGLNQLPTYGLLRDWSIPQIRDLVDLLVQAGYVRISGLDYPVLALSPKGLQAMKGEIPIELSRHPKACQPKRTRRKKFRAYRRRGDFPPRSSKIVD
jgi:ATP-dependent DNA helicase RecQ